MIDEPRVTVLMPVHDSVAFVGAALESILAQTFSDVEVVVIDDASSDGTEAVLRGCADPRLRSLRVPERGGVAVALNAGLRTARGEFVARMDADDIALPSRLGRQVEFLGRDPSVGIVGANVQPIDLGGRPNGPPTAVPTLPGHVNWMLHVHNCVNHPTVLARRDVLLGLGGYRSDAVPSEDYDLWVRAAAVTRIANIPDVVLQYRVHPESTSVIHERAAQAQSVTTAERALTRLLGDTPDRAALQVLHRPLRARLASSEVVRGAADLLWRFTAAVLDDSTLTNEEQAAIQRSAVEWFTQLVRAVAKRRPLEASKLVVPGRGGPPRWVLSEVVAGGRRHLITWASR